MSGQLAGYQRRFAAALLAEAGQPPEGCFAEQAHLSARFSVYRNNVYYSLGSALTDLYPVVHRLVGDDFFRAVAREWIRQDPPSEAAMVNFGSSFAGFLERFEATRCMPWLADVARLELARHRSYHAVDEEPMRADDLASIAPGDLLAARVRFAENVRLVRSDWPVVRIWAANQHGADSEQTINLDSGGEWALVYRVGYDVEIENLHPEEGAFVEAILGSRTLADALASSRLFPPEALLAGVIRRGLILKVEETE